MQFRRLCLMLKGGPPRSAILATMSTEKPGEDERFSFPIYFNKDHLSSFGAICTADMMVEPSVASVLAQNSCAKQDS